LIFQVEEHWLQRHRTADPSLIMPGEQKEHPDQSTDDQQPWFFLVLSTHSRGKYSVQLLLRHHDTVTKTPFSDSSHFETSTTLPLYHDSLSSQTAKNEHPSFSVKQLFGVISRLSFSE
jgi:hypothetical protein